MLSQSSTDIEKYGDFPQGKDVILDHGSDEQLSVADQEPRVSRSHVLRKIDLWLLPMVSAYQIPY